MSQAQHKEEIQNSETASRVADAAGAQIVDLDASWIEQVCELERLCCPNPWTDTLLERELKRELALTPGVVIAGKLIAHSFNYVVADELHILNLGVHPDFRQQGLGKRFLCFVLAEGIKRGARYATLEVRMSNQAAQRLYRALDFRSSGIRKCYYRDNQEDALVLERALYEGEAGEFARISGFFERSV